MPDESIRAGGYAVHRRGSSPLRVIRLEGEQAVVRHLAFGYEIVLPREELRAITWEEAASRRKRGPRLK